MLPPSRAESEALLSWKWPHEETPSELQTSGTLRFWRWADGRDDSTVTTHLSAGEASA